MWAHVEIDLEVELIWIKAAFSNFPHRFKCPSFLHFTLLMEQTAYINITYKSFPETNV